MPKTKNKNTKNRSNPYARSRRKSFFTPKNIAWIVIFVLLIAGAVVVTLKLFSPMKTPTSDDSGDKPAESTSSSAEPSNAMDNSDITDAKPETTTTTSTPTTTDKTPTQYEGANPNTLDKITGTITYNGVDGDTYKVRVTIDQLLSNTGRCTLTLKSANQTFTRTATTTDNPTSSTCQGFDIPIAQLHSGESYNVTIDIDAKNKTTTLTGTVKIP